MKNKINTVVVAFIVLAILLTGCGVSITKNCYYGDFYQRDKGAAQKENKRNARTDTLIITRHGFK